MLERACSITDEQVATYTELGFLDAIPVLTPAEVQEYRLRFDETCRALGGRVTRLDGLHLFFRWAWDLCTHPRLLDAIERLAGPDIVLKHSRIFSKPPQSSAYVGWHQDGYTENLSSSRAPSIWLGLTPATRENGCLRVIPGSQRVGPLRHDSRSNHEVPAHVDPGQQSPGAYTAGGEELSGRIAQVPAGLDPPHDVVMPAGAMSVHQPLILHGSRPNRSGEPRIGLSATYGAGELQEAGTAVAWVRGRRPPGLETCAAPTHSFEEALVEYRDSGRQILFAS